MERYSHVPYLQVDATEEHQEIGLTYSDSEVSREASPLIFNFPGMLNADTNQRIHHQEDYQRPSSDPTPTTMLPPISLAGGYSAYDDVANFMTPYSDDAPSSNERGDSYFPMMPGADCITQMNYDGLADQTIRGSPTFSRHSWNATLVEESTTY